MLMIYSELHAAARKYAQDGIPIFPCLPGNKAPACEGGFKSATTNLDQIDKWWSLYPTANIGMCPEDMGWAVVDVEASSRLDWELRDDVTPTFTVATPNGGLHAYYDGSVPSSVKSLIPGAAIDTRGRGGYVLLVPSVVQGKPYVVECDLPIAKLPEWVEAATARKAEAAPAVSTDHDQPANVARAIDWLRAFVHRNGKASAGNRSDTLYRLAAGCRDLGCSRDKAADLIAQIWFDDDSDGFSLDGEFQDVVDHAYKYARNGENAFALQPASEVFKDALPAVAAPKPGWKFETEADMEVEPKVEWLLPDLLPAKSTVLLAGRTGSYKSYLALDMALKVATTIGPVVYAGLEGMRSIRGSRRRAWKLHNGVDDLSQFYTARAPRFAVPDEIQSFGDGLKALGAKMVVIDTVSKSAGGLDIMSHKDVSQIIRIADSYRDELGVTVLLIHHMGKDDTKGAAGSFAFDADVDCFMSTKGYRDHRIVELTVHKFKETAEPDEPYVYEGETVEAVGDLCFRRVDRSVLAKAMAENNPLSTDAIGAMLRSLGAHGGKTVPLDALVSEIISRTSGPLGHDDMMKERRKIASKLKRMAALRAYNTEHGWCLP